jgi:predicted GNAT superfamily acetyltransferase
MTIAIRPVATYAEYMACEAIQRAVWGEFGAVPHHLLLTAQKNGGLLLGAFDTAAPGAPMVGFVFGFLARDARGLKHASHMAAVLPAYRDARIGERLKWAQRDQALAQGLERMTWTFDPLISRNARLNIRKLGAVCDTYIPNLYGPEPEEPEGELPSDRFQVDWWLASPRVADRSQVGPPAPGAAELRAAVPLANPDPLAPAALPAADRLLIQIPAEIEALKAADMPKARAWRYQVRAIALAAFAAGLVVTDYALDGDVGLYLLESQAAREKRQP